MGGWPAQEARRAPHGMIVEFPSRMAGRQRPRAASTPGRSEVGIRPGHPDTTYLCVVDEAPNVVSYIHSLYAGNGVVAGDTGIRLQPDGLLQPR